MLKSKNNYLMELTKVSTIRHLGVVEKALVIFTRDKRHEYDDFKGRKRDSHEAEIYTPFVGYWSNRIKIGCKTDCISAFWNVLPTHNNLIKENSNMANELLYIINKSRTEYSKFPLVKKRQD